MRAGCTYPASVRVNVVSMSRRAARENSHAASCAYCRSIASLTACRDRAAEIAWNASSVATTTEAIRTPTTKVPSLRIRMASAI